MLTTHTRTHPPKDHHSLQEVGLLDDPLSQDVQDIDTRRYPGAFSSDEPSPYEKSGAASDDVAVAARENPHRLHNARDPFYNIKREKAEHRVVCFLKAEGFTNKEIAEKTGLTTVTISNVLRQPWAQQQVLQIIHENGGDAVRQLLVTTGLKAVQRLVVEMDNEEARPSERIVAADKILDRLYGKPNQPIEHRGDALGKMTDEELEAIAKLGQRGGGNPTES
jgi:lambda repressor-like predicted transcriptional regulator